jgi:hypothetical protein
MTRIFTLILPLFISVISIAQIECDPPNDSLDISVNDIQARLSTGGDIFYRRNVKQPGFQVFSSSMDSAHSIYSANIWIAGRDQNGVLRNTTETYPDNVGYNWTSGPLNEFGLTTEYTCKKWDRLFKATKSDIEAHKLDFAEDGVIDFEIPDILFWPGNENVHFIDKYGFKLPENAGGLAPFFDINNNGIYEPLTGEFPLPERISPYQIPDIIVWCIFNDIGNAYPAIYGDRLGIEVHSTVYAYSSINTVIDRTIFRSYKILPKQNFEYAELKVGHWTDIDIGCFGDDYIGCIPEMNTYYGYNADALDEVEESVCIEVETYGESPPVQSVTILNHPMNSFIGYYAIGIPGVSGPHTPSGYFNLMEGIWAGGTPLTYGGNGYNPGSEDYVDFIYPDLPTILAGWSMLSHEVPMGDMKSLGVTHFNDISKGDEINIDIAYTFHQEKGNDNLENVGLMYEQIPLVKDFYEGNTTSTRDWEINEQSIVEIYPNPATEYLYLKSNGIVQERSRYRIIALNGEVLQTGILNELGLEFSLDPGIYLIEIEDGGKLIMKKFIVSE